MSQLAVVHSSHICQLLQSFVDGTYTMISVDPENTPQS